MSTVTWFSPLPPARSGIADYSVPVLRALARSHPVHAFSPSAPDDIPDIATAAMSGAPDHALLESSRAVVYHLGNHPGHHGAIWRRSLARPGMVVLHDEFLHHSFYELFAGDRSAHRLALRRWHGESAARALDAATGDAGALRDLLHRYPLTGLATVGATAIAVHQSGTADRLRDVFRGPVQAIPLAYWDRIAPTPRPGTPGGSPHRLVCFGYLGANRGLSTILEALAAPDLKERFRLTLFGQIGEPEVLEQALDRTGTRGVVEVLGHLDSATKDATLASAHLGINLRYPTMGEASLSQLELWSHALPTIVTRVGWYAELPADCVVHLDPSDQVGQLRSALRAFDQDPARFAAMGTAGKARLSEHHSPGRYADAVIELADEANRWAPEHAKIAAMRRIANRCPGLASDPEGVAPSLARAVADAW